MTNQTANQTESPTSQTPNEGNYGIDWLWILYVVLYSVLFAFIGIGLEIPNGWAVFLLGIIALAALKYLIRSDG